MITKRKGTKLVAVLAGVSLIAAACGDDDDPDDTTVEDTTATTAGGGGTTTPMTGTTTPMTGTTTPTSGTTGSTGSTTPTSGTTTDTTTEMTGTTVEGAEGGTITYGEAQEFSDYNNNTVNGNSVKNGLILNRVLPDAFNFTAPDGSLEMDEELLDSAEITNEDPQVVQFVVNAEAAWSDGEPIDCDDWQLAWLSSSGKWIQQDDAGAPVTDPDTGLELPVFDTAGTTGYDQIETMECSEDGKTIDVTWGSPYGDWAGLFGNLVPAHIVEQEAGVDDIATLLDFENAPYEQVKAAGDFWTTGWVLEPGTLKPEIMPSGDAFTIDSWEAGQAVTLVPNEAYWGTPPSLDSVVVRVIADDAQSQALQNEEIQTMDPQPTPDLLTQLEGFENVTVETGSAFTFEHFDFNFRNEALAQLEVRQAFAKCLPRQQMVDQLIVPTNPEAEVLNSRWFEDFEPDYQDNSGGEYQDVDIEGAQALLEEAGVETPLQLRIGWLNDPAAPNQRRADEVALTTASCAEAGFEIIDAGSPTFFDVELPEGDFDIAMFAWSGSSLKSGTSSTYQTNGGNNQGNYSSEDVDALIEELNAELDPARINELANEIDTILWEDLATIPVFTFPSLTATSNTAVGIEPNPAQNGLTWNIEQWQVAAE